MNILLLGSLGLGLVFATPPAASTPSAQNVEQSDQLSAGNARIEQGHRISDGGDFQIIEHGHWSPHPREALAVQSVRDGQQILQVDLHPLSNSERRPTNFRRAAFLPYVHAAEARFGLPTGLLDALIWAESKYNPLAVSHAGAAGLGQLMPGTAKDLGVANRFDPYSNITGAARYLRQMLDLFGQTHLALAAYNAGPGAVSRVKGIPSNGETPSYVRNILSFWQRN